MKKICLFIALVFLFPALVFATPETLVGDKAAAGFPVYGQGSAGNLKVAYGYYDITAAVEAGDVFNLCRLPKNAVVVGGWLYATDLDATSGVEALDIDIGWATNGTENADTDGFLNAGIWIGDAVTNYKPEVGNAYPFGGILMQYGRKKFTAETVIQAYVNTAAATFSAGTIAVKVEYFVEP